MECESFVQLSDYPSLNGDSIYLKLEWKDHLYTTNLNKVKERVSKYPALSDLQMELVRKRIDGLLQMIESKPKSSSWKLRAKIGPRKKWYEDVEEVIR